MENDFEVTAEVHKFVGTAYRVKALVHDIGIYINGMMVFPPNDEHDWSVYPPLLGRAGRGKYRYTIEFNKQYPLWNEIREACIEAVKLELGSDIYVPDSQLVVSTNPTQFSPATKNNHPEPKFM